MAYRDDVDALFHRARTLQAEVDQLREELAAERARPRAADPAPPPPPLRSLRFGKQVPLPEPPPAPPPTPLPPTPDPDDVLRNVLSESRDRHVWLPFTDGSSAEIDALHERAIRAPSERHHSDVDFHIEVAAEPDVGLLVARLSAVEHALVIRLLELLTDDNFRRAQVARRLTMFDQLVPEIRDRLTHP